MGWIDNQGQYHEGSPSEQYAPEKTSFLDSLVGGGVLGIGGNLIGGLIKAFSDPNKRAYKYWMKGREQALGDVEKLRPTTPYYNMASNNMQGFNELLGRVLLGRLGYTSGETIPESKAKPRRVGQGTPENPREVRYPWMKSSGYFG